MILRFGLLLLTFLTACSSAPVQKNESFQSPTPKRELKKNIPNASWVKIYFEGIDNNDYQGIDKIVERNNIYKLREKVLAEDDFEIRIWVGFGKYGNDGFILKKSSGEWSAIYLSEMLCHLENRGKFNLDNPKSSWENVWQKLVGAGILTLPDSSELDYKDGAVDGKSYVVETNADYVYRTYQYSNPPNVKLKEARQIMKIGEIISDEFGLESFSAETGGCGRNEPN